MARDNGVTALDFPSTADGHAAHDDARISTHTDRPDQSPLPADPALAERYARVFTPALAHYSSLVVERAEGSYLYTRDGRRYLDLGSGIATTNVGHSHPQVVAAAEAQLRHVTHLSITAYHEAPVALAERLARIAPPGLSRVFFGNSGAEAVEGALKVAKRVTGRRGVVAFAGGFHGRTYGALSVTTSNPAYRAGYAPFVPETYFAPYPARGWSVAACLRYLDSLLGYLVRPEDVAAMIVEPVQGEGGVIVPPAAFLRGLRERCDRHGIILIFDEVQTGFGRTGAMFAAQRYGVTPDVLAVAKAIASGFPLSAVIGRDDLMAAWPEASHGTTFGGNLVACAAGLATLDVLESEHLPQRARALGTWLLGELRGLASRHSSIAAARGLGLMIGIECQDPRLPATHASAGTPGGDASGRAARAVAAEVERRCLDAGILVLHCGRYGEVVRLLPPLNVAEADLARALDALDTAFAAVEHRDVAPIPEAA